jgi:hypothetical protein
VPSATVSFASASATRDTPQSLLPLPNFPCPRSPAALRAAAEVRHRRPGPSSRHCRHRGVPGVRLEVRNLPCPLPSFLLLSAALNSSPESINAAAEPLRRELPPLRCPCPDLAPAGRFPAPSPTSQATPVALRTRRTPPRPCLRRASPPRVRPPPPPQLAGEGDRSQPPHPRRPSQIGWLYFK